MHTLSLPASDPVRAETGPGPLSHQPDTARPLAAQMTGALPAFDPDRPRQSAEALLNYMIDRQMDLLGFLDDLAADPDLEPDEDAEPSIGGNPLNFEMVDCELDDADNEPSLGAGESEFSSTDYFASQRRIFMAIVPNNTQLGWGAGSTFNPDCEDEHDGAEPDNEHGGGWPEASSAEGTLSGGGAPEDDEPTLGFTEHVNQASRTLTTGEWRFGDGEADYVAEVSRGRYRAHVADDEDQFGVPAMRLPNGKIVNDREATDCGYYRTDGRGSSYDDNGVGDDGGRCEAHGVAA